MIIEKGREYWRKVNHLQKNLMTHMKMEKVIEVRPDGHVLFEAEGKRYIIEPSGEVMAGGTYYLDSPAKHEREWYLGEYWDYEYATSECLIFRSADQKKRLYIFWDGHRMVRPVSETIPQTVRPPWQMTGYDFETNRDFLNWLQKQDPTQLTQSQYVDRYLWVKPEDMNFETGEIIAKGEHKGYIRDALSRGIPIAHEILASYPDLKAKFGEKEPCKPWWEQLKRSDCRKCVYRKFCGDMYPAVGKCPGNSGGESWAVFKEGPPIDYGVVPATEDYMLKYYKVPPEALR